MNASAALASPDELMRRASAVLSAGRIGAARPLIAAVRRLVPAGPAVAHLSARLAMQEERLADAAAELDAAIADEPSEPALRKLRAELRLRMDDVSGAAADAAEAVVLQPADPAAKALLGVVLLLCGQAVDAAACLADAVRSQPANPAFLQGLAAAQEASGDDDAAAETLEAGIARCPDVAVLRGAAMLLSMRRSDPESAIRLAETAQRAGAIDACVLGLKGHALSALGRHDDAAEAYAEALKLAPEDPYVRHLVAASGALPGADRAPQPYVKAVFDGYADGFEAHILSLGYRVPGLFRGALLRCLPSRPPQAAAGPVLDLGCGTGLVAVACADLLPGPWTGLDLSPAMLRAATAKALYADLQETDLLVWLRRDTRSWSTILAGDSLCYLGDLAEPFAGVRARLADAGLFVLSLEEAVSGAPGWSLRAKGRYAHTLAYLEQAASGAGLLVREVERQVLRREGGRGVPGLIAVLEPAG
jgi:predicted TPR repeat methyltransferase